jgi:protease I
VRYFAYNQKPIGAICHGVQLLTAAGVLKGRKCTSYCAVAPEITLAGGHYIELPVDRAHADGNLVTAPAWPAHGEWLAKLLQVVNK